MKKIWIARAEYFHRYDTEESDVRLEQYYENREDAHKVYAHGEKKCAEAGITDLQWSLHSIYIEERVEFGLYMADKVIEEALEGEKR
jgi:hypothetical protein